VLLRGEASCGPGHLLLSLCVSDARGQCGDVRGALDGFRAVAWSCGGPLPRVHAARLYAQLGHVTAAHGELLRARELDPTFCGVYVEMAQLCVQMRLLRRGGDREGVSCKIGGGGDCFADSVDYSGDSADYYSARIEQLLDRALQLARHLSEVRDIETVRISADIQATLIAKGGFYG